MDQIKRLLAGLSIRQRILIVVAAAAVIAALAGVLHWNRERNFKPLYSGLAAEDAGAVLAKLRETAVDYRLSDNGTSVLVPASRVAELRLQMASAGLPKTGRIGFELFDRTNFGTSDFAEQVNYHRALEGELERSIMSLTEVEQARVHVTLAKDSVFTDARQPAKASVLVKLKIGTNLSPQNVLAIEHLVASAVEGLAPESVSVLDMRGSLLSRPRRPDAEGAEPSEAVLDYKRKIERDLLAKIQATLEPVLGAARYQAGVSVECDFSSGEQSEETWDPTKSVMATSQRSEDMAGSGAASGIPGTASNLPRPASRPGASGSTVTRRTENITYQSSRTVRKMKLPQGNVRRQSVSLILDQEARWDGTGAKAKRVLTPVSEERLKVVRELVAVAVGLNTERGDQIVVQSLPFEATRNAEPPPEPGAPPAAPAPIGLPAWLTRILAQKNIKVSPAVILAAGGALLLLLLSGIGFLVFKLLGKGGRKAKGSEGAAALPSGESGEPKAIEEPREPIEKRLEARMAEQAALRDQQEQEALASLKVPQITSKKGEVLSKHISDGAKRNPAVAAQIIRSWINEKEH